MPFRAWHFCPSPGGQSAALCDSTYSIKVSKALAAGAY